MSACSKGWRSALVLAAVACASSLAFAAVRPTGSRASSDFGLDTDLVDWSLGYTHQSIQGLIVNQMTVCTDFFGFDDNNDGQIDRCGNGNYMFVVQIPYAPDDATITFSGLQGFDGADTSYGFMACSSSASSPDYINQTTLALCTPDPTKSLYNSLLANVSIPGDNSSVTMSFAPYTDPDTSLSTTRFPQGGITIFIRENTGDEALPAPPAPIVGITGSAGLVILPIDMERTASDQALKYVEFGNVPVGKKSETQSVTIFNSGLTPVLISVSPPGSNFTSRDNCPVNDTLAPQASCTVFINFIPSGPGLWSGSVFVSTWADGNSLDFDIGLLGWSISSNVVLSSSTLDFGSELVSTLASTATGSPAQTIHVTNPSSGSSVPIFTPTVTANPKTGVPDFVVTKNSACDTATPSVDCVVSVVALPRLLGPTTATLTIVDKNNDYHLVKLRALGSSPQTLTSTSPNYFPLNPSNAVFGSQAVGTVSSTSAPFTGTASLFAPTAGFQVTPGSGSFSVKFAPLVGGDLRGSVHLFNHVGMGFDIAYLQGVGLPPIVSLSKTSVVFGRQPLATPSADHSVLLSNTGAGNLNISDISVAGNQNGDFILNDFCGATVTGGTSCNLSFTFNPTVAGPRKAVVVITDNADGSPRKIHLTGTGVAVALSPASWDFGSQATGSSGAAKSITLTNLGGVPVHIWNKATTGAQSSEFQIQGGDCPVSPLALAAYATCTIDVKFVPSTTGARSASLMISHDGGGSPGSVPLSGTGVLPLAPSGLVTFSGTVTRLNNGDTIPRKKSSKSGSGSTSRAGRPSGSP